MKNRRKRSPSRGPSRASKRRASGFSDKMTPVKSERVATVQRPSLPVTGAVDMDWKLLRRFYEPMLLLNLLDPVRGQRIDRPTDPELDALSSTELRRAFVDKLAYLCDFRKGGDTITAIALQNTPQGVIIHCAANDHVKPRVQAFIREILDLLLTVNYANHAEVEALIFKKAISLSRDRLRTYWRWADEIITKCLKHLQKELIDLKTALELSSWLNELQRTAESTSSLVTKCYKARNSSHLRVLGLLSAEGKPHCRVFRDLRHYIGRLGAHRKATKTLVAAVAEASGFLEGFSVEVERSSPLAYCSLLPGDTTAYSIVGRMCTKDGATRYRDALKHMDSSYELNLDAALVANCAFETRVHAELILSDVFVRRKYEFVGNDRYIGCSKPACYSCYQYFCAQSTSIVLPVCHNKLYLRWRPPDIFDKLDLEAIQRRNDSMNKMNIKIREEIKEQLDKRTLTRRHHFDSTTGKSIAIDIENFQKHSKAERSDSVGTHENVVEGMGSASERSSTSLESSSEESWDDSDGGVAVTTASHHFSDTHSEV